MKKSSYFFTALFLSLMMLTGCGESDKKKEQATESSKAEMQQNASQENAEAEEKKSAALRETNGKKKVIIGIDEHYPPFSMRDRVGALIGLDIDLAEELARRMDVDIEFQMIDWGEKKNLLDNKEIDMIMSGMAISEERKKSYGFSIPYLKASNGIVVLPNSPIKTAGDLANRVVACVSDSESYEFLQGFKSEKGPVKEIVEYPNPYKALVALMMQKAGIEAVMADEMVVRYYISHTPGKFVFVPNTFRKPTDIGAGMRKTDNELRGNMDSALRAMQKDGSLNKILTKWLGTVSQ